MHSCGVQTELLGFRAGLLGRKRTLGHFQTQGSEGFMRKPAPPERTVVTTEGGGGRRGPWRIRKDGKTLASAGVLPGAPRVLGTLPMR